MGGTPIRQLVIERVWRGADPFAEAPDSGTPDFQGWGSHHPYLTEAIHAYGSSCLALEVGVWKGTSVITMAERMRALGINGAVIAVDTWLGAWDHWTMEEWFPHLRVQCGYPRLYDTFLSNVVTTGLQDYIVPLPLDSVNAARVIQHFGFSLDVVHIDGGHDFRAVLADLESWWPLLQPGGVLIGDDYHMGGNVWPEVRRAFDCFFAMRDLLPLENVQGKCRILKPAEPASVCQPS